MKKALALLFLALSLTFGVEVYAASPNPNSSVSLVAGYNAVPASVEPQRWNRGRRILRSRLLTRNVWMGRRLYRVTYRITTDRFGRTRSTVVRRIRLR